MAQIFTLTSGRSGTTFLYSVLKKDVQNAYCTHEPLGWRNPSMFGQPIYDHHFDRQEVIERVLRRKQWRNLSLSQHGRYMEASHAFLKSFYDLAPRYFPDLKLIHSVGASTRVVFWTEVEPS